MSAKAEGSDPSKSSLTHAKHKQHIVDIERHEVDLTKLGNLELLEQQKFARQCLRFTISTLKNKEREQYWTLRLQSVNAELKTRGF